MAKVIAGLALALCLGCSGEGAVPNQSPDAGPAVSPDYYWCKSAGWPQVPRCDAAKRLRSGERTPHVAGTRSYAGT